MPNKTVTSKDILDAVQKNTKRLDVHENHIKHIPKILERLDVHTEYISSIPKMMAKLNKLDERTKYFPKLYQNVDKLVTEIQESRQERAFISHRLENHEKRITKLEKPH